ncbi:hypothetical protein BrevBR_00910 [Brevundimonas sp. BR2-1]|uniref:hypothetical protein n=1 Tax=unclassified Brevundimonas TaxID=2622653 RepID=UPI0025C4A4D3|nr:hypothetical protein [Brevundimonas sp. UBA7664]
MSSRLILSIAGLTFAICGLASLFASDELASLSSTSPSSALAPALQIIGGALLGFALLNWFNRRSRVGGIYGRPIGLANLMFSGVLAITVGRAALQGALPVQASLLAGIFGAITLAFGWLAFGTSAASG